MKTFLFLILSLFALTANAQQNYYEFGWNNQYGIVDKDGNETLSPSYQWVSRLIDNESPFIVLNGNKGAVITNKQTGKMEKIDYLIDTYLISIDKKDYMYAHSSGNGFLLNNLDLDSRIKLPKKYIKVRDEGDYLTGFTSKKTIDFISKKDFEIKKKILAPEEIESYPTKQGNRVYIISEKNSTLFLDDNLNKIASTNTIFKGFDNLKEYLEKLNISITDPNESMVGVAASAANYPFIFPKRNGDYAIYNIHYSKEESIPFFQFKRTGFSIYNSRYENSVTLENNHDNMYLFFYTDVRSKTILLPKKYWKSIDLQLISP
ncbi:MAG: hypothetical protein HG446_002615 [Flavobacteriaceae bacterium]|nr:hypothetical protein [Flavobacteriaceae bacterium]